MEQTNRPQGWVYVVTNPSLPELVKVGYTTRPDVEARLREFDQAGLPYPYEVAYKRWVAEPRQLEKRVHQFLTIERENKEWFRCSVERAQEAIDHLAPVHTELLQEPGMSSEPNTFSDSGWSGYSEEPNARFEVDDEQEGREEELPSLFWAWLLLVLVIVALSMFWIKIVPSIFSGVGSEYRVYLFFGLLALTFKIILYPLANLAMQQEKHNQNVNTLD